MDHATTERGSGIVKIEGLHHYTISVADMDESARWYERIFGFKLIYEKQRHGWGTVAYAQAPGFLLEMFAVPGAEPVPQYAAGPEPNTDLTVCGHKHLALLLRGGVSETVGELKALGATVVSFKTVSFEGMGEFKAAFMVDNTGGLIELPEDSSQADPAAPASDVGSRPVGIKGLHHVAVCVHDREEAVRWYSKVFGFTVATTFEVPVIGLRTAMMQCPGFWMELHSMAGAASVPPRRRTPESDVRTLGNKYFALAVRDLTGVRENLEKAGVEVVADLRTGYSRRLFVSDNSGNPIELFQILN